MAPGTEGSRGLKRLLTPDNCAVILIDHQPQMAFGVQSIDRQELLNNTVGLAKAARLFKVPTVLTTVAEKSFSGPLFPEIPPERRSASCFVDCIAFLNRYYMQIGTRP